MTQLRFTLLFLLMAAIPVVQAQEGHPLVGTWQGSWGENNNFLTIIMNWDGQRISGIVNPGPGSTEIETGSLDSSSWRVELGMPLNDDTGNSADFTLEGEITNVTSRTRSINGSWRYRGDSGSFILTRQSGA
ncbi:MAG: hypothetical protein HOG19_16290 [Gammaproteobacteria bacterium]|jgi:hypothetical protein|nr:hypothetical protein [Gammaproteobacteria bacterium]